MATTDCLYAGTLLRDDVPNTQPDSRSLEHIIPLSMGRSDGFTTRDVSQGANRRAGSEIDGPRGLRALNELFGKGPFQWALKRSADVGMAAGLPDRRSLLLLDATTRAVERAD